MAGEDKCRVEPAEGVSTLLQPQPQGIPLPVPSAVTAPFWDGCAAGELRYQRCNECDSAIFNPAAICPYCTGTDLRWDLSNGLGVIYSWSIVWRPSRPAFRTPYAPVIVELDEGFRLISNVIDIETSQVHTGLPVRVAFHDHRAITLPYFTPR